MKANWTRVWVSVVAAVAFLAGGAVGAVVYRQAQAESLTVRAGSGKQELNVGLISEAWDAIRKNYVVPSSAQPEDMTYGAIRGMVDALGDTGHSTFLTPSMREQQQSLIEGHFEGIGVEIEVKDGQFVVVAPLDGSPAQKAGLAPGDIITRVDGQNVTSKPMDDVVRLVLGPAGTSVTLTIVDPNNRSTRDVTVQRARIEVHSLSWEFVPGTRTAHVRLATFSSGVGGEVGQALDEIQKAGATGILLDLRNNPGGLLSEAIEVTSRFVRHGTVLQEKDAQGRISSVPVTRGLLSTDLPTVVLINAGSASAAEIVAGALQDAGRARLVGETTFGTGTVLNEYRLSDGSALLLATELWLTPKGRVIWHQGIEPDVKVELPDGESPLVPRQEKMMTAPQLRSAGDAQLLRALELLSR